MGSGYDASLGDKRGATSESVYIRFLKIVFFAFNYPNKRTCNYLGQCFSTGGSRPIFGSKALTFGSPKYKVGLNLVKNRLHSMTNVVDKNG